MSGYLISFLCGAAVVAFLWACDWYAREKAAMRSPVFRAGSNPPAPTFPRPEPPPSPPAPPPSRHIVEVA